MRGVTLVLETATPRGSVAVATGDALVHEIAFDAVDLVSGTRREALVPSIAACLDAARVDARAIDQVVTDAGPGGFTSLRTAAAVAKGICAALQRSLYAVSSLELLAHSAALADGRYVVALEAGRGEYFAAPVTAVGGVVETGTPVLAGPDALATLGGGDPVRTVGPGLDIDAWPRAAAVIPLLAALRERGPVSLDHWEPAYGRPAEAQARWEAAHGRPLIA